MTFDLRAHMPLLTRQEGVWEGVYRYYDADGNKIDEHRSRLICRVPRFGSPSLPPVQRVHLAGRSTGDPRVQGLVPRRETLVRQ